MAIAESDNPWYFWDCDYIRDRHPESVRHRMRQTDLHRASPTSESSFDKAKMFRCRGLERLPEGLWSYLRRDVEDFSNLIPL